MQFKQTSQYIRVTSQNINGMLLIKEVRDGLVTVKPTADVLTEFNPTLTTLLGKPYRHSKEAVLTPVYVATAIQLTKVLAAFNTHCER